MSCTGLIQQDKTIYKGQTARFLITVTDENGERFDLTGHTLYLRVKKLLTDANPGIISLSSGSGITHRTQTGSTIGQADAVMSSAQTDLLTTPPYLFDCWIQLSGGEKYPLMDTSKLNVKVPVVDI